MRPAAPIERVEPAVYRIPTDRPDAGGRLIRDPLAPHIIGVEGS
jgi:hypothetical protein